jgi:hypothetical protein
VGQISWVRHMDRKHSLRYRQKTTTPIKTKITP